MPWSCNNCNRDRDRRDEAKEDFPPPVWFSFLFPFIDSIIRTLFVVVSDGRGSKWVRFPLFEFTADCALIGGVSITASLVACKVFASKAERRQSSIAFGCSRVASTSAFRLLTAIGTFVASLSWSGSALVGTSGVLLLFIPILYDACAYFPFNAANEKAEASRKPLASPVGLYDTVRKLQAFGTVIIIWKNACGECGTHN